jgi:hypothetical protein
LSERSRRLADAGELPLALDLPVLGVPVRFETDSPAIRDVIQDSFGEWEDLRHYPELVEVPGFRVRCAVGAGREHAPPSVPITYRLPDPGRLLITTNGSVGVADVSRGDAIAYVTEELVRDRAHFQYGVLEALTLFLATRHDRVPLHAAAVTRDGVAVLLAGASGTGKSTLVYAALSAGFQLLAEDMVFLQTSPVHRIWGHRGFVCLPPESTRFFDGLADELPQLVANGKRKHAVTVPRTQITSPPVVDDGVICLLERGAGASQLRACDVPELRAGLLTDLEPGFDLFRDAVDAAVAPLLRTGGWRLLLSDDPHAAVPLLEEAVAHVVSQRTQQSLGRTHGC